MDYRVLVNSPQARMAAVHSGDFRRAAKGVSFRVVKLV
jgi:hypothetical protein